MSWFGDGAETTRSYCHCRRINTSFALALGNSLKQKKNIIGNGVVIDPVGLVNEIETLENRRDHHARKSAYFRPSSCGSAISM